ncbi:MAG: hypothetical protein EA357_11025 [Micavibrio sp.]|nr:MAG: hypothetical protein EA357_11025 [Micavibrio sp.]
MSKWRVLIGFLVAPGLPALLVYLTVLFLGNDAWSSSFVPVVLAIIAYVYAWALGIPAYILLRRKGVDRFAVYLALGALIGLSQAYVLSFGYFAGILVIPAYFLLRRKGTNFTVFPVAATFIGLTVFYVLYWVWYSYSGRMPDLKAGLEPALIAITYAATSTAAFWLIAVRETKAEKAAG